jgi:hypothetical protein
MTNKIKAKEILKDKFWIIEEEGIRIGTLSINEDKYMFSGPEGTKYFDSERALKKTFGKDILITQVHAKAEPVIDKSVYGYPTSCIPYNSMYDVKHKLPLFTKSDKSKSLYCAGYYIVHFDKGWVKSFCPKMITVDRYESQGPFKTELEMRQALSKANAK